MSDDDLRRAFEALRAHDESEAPSFPPMRLRAERRTRRRRVAAVLTAFVAAALVLLAVFAREPAPSAKRAAAPRPERPTLPLTFLLEPPSASVLVDDPLVQIGEAW